MVSKFTFIFFVLVGFAINAQTPDTLMFRAEADSLINKAKSLRYNQEKFQAIQAYEKAINLYNEISDPESEAYILRAIGSIFSSLNNYATAIEYYKNSIKKIKKTGRDKHFESSLLKPYKLLHFVNKDENLWEIAEKYGISVQEIISTNSFEDPDNIDIGDKINIHIIDKYLLRKYFLGDCYNRIGFNYKESLDFNNAIIYFDSSLVIRKKLNDNIGYGMVLNNIGTVYHYTANYEKAIGYYNRSLYIRSKLGDLSGSAKLHTNIGSVLGKLTNYDSALSHLEKALLIRERLKKNDAIGFTLLHMGIIYMHLEDYYNAENILIRARSIFQESQNKKLIGISSVDLGFFYFKKGDYIKAREYLNEGLDISRELEIKRTMAAAQRGIGFTYLEQGIKFIPKEYFDKALKLAKIIGAEDEVVRCEYGLGKYYFNNNDYDSAISHLKSAIDLSEKISKKLFSETYKIGYMRNIISIYKMIIQAYLKNNKKEKAFYYVEKMKARTLLDILDGGQVGNDEFLTKEELTKEDNLVSQLEGLNTLITKTSDDVMDSLVELRKGKRDELLNFRNQLYNRHPELKNSRGKGKPITFRKAKRITGKNEAVVYYLIMENELITLFITHKTLEIRSQKIKQVDLDVLIGRILSSAKSQKFRPGYWDTNASSELYTILISPLQDLLKDKQRICIIPDGKINYIPFGALIDNNGKYFIEEYDIYYAPSLSTLSWLRMFPTSGNRDLLALGNPVFTEKDTNNYNFRDSLTMLPSTEIEVNLLKEIYESNAKILLGLEASETNFIGNAGNYGILHLATHAIMNENNPMFSSIWLSSSENDDGFLEAGEIIKMELNSELVILSACNTARGRLLEGEGMLGLTRAFFTADVPSVVSSLWNVEDVATSKLMVEFHKRIKRGEPPIKSLREAKLYMMTQQEYKNPFYWAPFILIGKS